MFRHPLYLGNLLLVLLWLDIRSNEELSEQIEEGKNVDNVGGSHSPVACLTSAGKKVASLRHHCHKLNKLQHGERRLPPDGEGLASLGVLCVHADEVISVHDGVDEAVQTNGEVDITVIENIGIQPVEEENGGVVVNVQKGKLSPLLSQDNENGIPEIPGLGHVEEPQQWGHGGIVGVEGIARHQGVVVTVRKENCFNCHVGTEHDLRDIVEKFDGVWINGSNPRLHNSRPNEDESEVSRGDAEGGGEISEEPSL